MPPIVLIASPPLSISPAEHRQLVASTPASFSDIPPILRHKEEGVTVSLDPPLDGFFAEEHDAKGTLYVTESVLAFISDSGRGFQIAYPSITLHAISREETDPSIYCQLDEGIPFQNIEAPDEEEVRDMRELKLIPTVPSSLEPIFEALSICAALHPDPQGSDGDMDDAFVDAAEEDFETFAGDEVQELSEVGRASLAYLESIIDDNTAHEKESSSEPPAKVNGTH